jgi:hypothetical protein
MNTDKEVSVMELDSLQVTLDIPGMGRTKVAWAQGMDGSKILMLGGVDDQKKLFHVLERLAGRPVPALTLVPPEPDAPAAEIFDITQAVQAGRVTPLETLPVVPAQERTERPTVQLTVGEDPNAA